MKKLFIMVSMMVVIITGCTKPVEEPDKNIDEINYHEDVIYEVIETEKVIYEVIETEKVIYEEN